MGPEHSSRKDLRVMQAIYFLPVPTRNEIARLTARSPVSVTEILNRLMSRKLVERFGKTQSRSGRPSSMYRLGEGTGYCVGISMDASAFRLVALDARHQILQELDKTLSLSADPSSHLDDIVRTLSSELRLFLDSLRLRDRRALTIGITPPGMVDTEKGIWLHGLQVSGIAHAALGETLEKMFGVPVVVEDTARCLAYVAASGLPAQLSRDLVYLYLGTGVGAGIMIGQEPYHGSHGMAGEVGHLVVEQEGARCACGNIGCLETVLSGGSILQRFERRLSEGVMSSLQTHRAEGLTLELIRDAAREGDRLASSTLFELGTLLGDAVSKIIMLYNPRTLLIGGPVGVLGEHLREPMWIQVRRRVLSEMLVDLSVDFAPSKPREEAIGAAFLAERRYWKEATEKNIFWGDE